MANLLIILLVILILISCSENANIKVGNTISKLTNNKIPLRYALPIVKIILSIIMLILPFYGLLTNICLILIIIQNLIYLKKI